VIAWRIGRELSTPTVSVIIPSFNRHQLMVDAVESVLLQTIPVTEILVIDDGSSDRRYRTFRRPRTTVIRRARSTRRELGHPAPGIVRNEGLDRATGEYIAFCDDDDVWLPWKLEKQFRAMKRHGCLMSSTEGYLCPERWNSRRLTAELRSGFRGRFPRYNREAHWRTLKRLCGLQSRFPVVWDLEFLQRHNSMITSSVIVHRSLIKPAGYFEDISFGEDYRYWLRLLQSTNSAYVNTPCFGYCRGLRKKPSPENRTDRHQRPS
jgi:glycosyltransferase involved in cell wall biosynthesis